jgi:hypothetical protein
MKAYVKSKKAKPIMSKEAAEWDKKQRERAMRIEKEAKRRAKALRNMKIAKKKEEERVRKAAERKAFLEKVEYQPPRVPQHIRRAPPLDAPHAVTRLSQGVKEEELRWKSGEGFTSDADRAAAAADIAKAVKQTELERQQGIDRAEAAAAKLVENGVKYPNPYLDHASYDPATAHMSEEAASATRFPIYQGVGSAGPELGNLGVGAAILMWVVLLVAIIKCQRRRGDASQGWMRDTGGRGFWDQGRKKRQSEEQEREKLDV